MFVVVLSINCLLLVFHLLPFVAAVAASVAAGVAAAFPVAAASMAVAIAAASAAAAVALDGRIKCRTLTRKPQA